MDLDRNKLEDRLEDSDEFAFTVDKKKQMEKMKDHMHADPHYYIKEFMQLALENGASMIEVNTSPKKTEISFNGEGFSRNWLDPEDSEDNPWRQLAKKKKGTKHKPTKYEGLPLGILSATSLEKSKKIVFETAQGDEKTKMTVFPDLRKEMFESLKEKGTKITVMKSPDFGEYMANSFNKNKIPESRIILDDCQFMPIDVYLNGKKVSRPMKLQDMLVQAEFSDGDIKGVIGIPGKRDDSVMGNMLTKRNQRYDEQNNKKKNKEMGYSQVTFLRNGIIQGIRKEEEGVNKLNAYRAVVNNDDLNLILSRNDISEDAQFKKVKKAVKKGEIELHGMLYSKYHSFSPKDKKYADDRMKAFLRTNGSDIDMNTKNTGDGSYKIRQQKLFRGIGLNRVSLDEIAEDMRKFGQISYTDSAMHGVKPFNDRKVVIMHYGNDDFDIIENIFGNEKIKDYTDDLKKEKKMAGKLGGKWGEQAYGKKLMRPRLKNNLVVSKVPIDTDGLLGEIGLRRTVFTKKEEDDDDFAKEKEKVNKSSILIMKDGMPVKTEEVSIPNIRIDAVINNNALEYGSSKSDIRKDDEYKKVMDVVNNSIDILFQKLVNDHTVTGYRLGRNGKRDVDLESHLISGMMHYFKYGVNYGKEDTKDVREKLASKKLFDDSLQKPLDLQEIIDDVEKNGNLCYTSEKDEKKQKAFNNRKVVVLDTPHKRRLMQLVFGKDNLEDYTNRLKIEGIAAKNMKKDKISANISKRKVYAKTKIDSDGITGEIGIPKVQNKFTKVKLCINNIPLKELTIEDYSGKYAGVVNFNNMTPTLKFDDIENDANLEAVMQAIKTAKSDLYDNLLAKRKKNLFGRMNKKNDKRILDYIKSVFDDKGPDYILELEEGNLEHKLANLPIFSTTKGDEVSLSKIAEEAKKNGMVPYIQENKKGDTLDGRLVIPLTDANKEQSQVLFAAFSGMMNNYLDMFDKEQLAQKNLKSGKAKSQIEGDKLASIEIDENGVKGEIALMKSMGDMKTTYDIGKLALMKNNVKVNKMKLAGVGLLTGVINNDEFDTNVEYSEIKKNYTLEKTLNIVNKKREELYGKLADQIDDMEKKDQDHVKNILKRYIHHKMQKGTLSFAADKVMTKINNVKMFKTLDAKEVSLQELLEENGNEPLCYVKKSLVATFNLGAQAKEEAEKRTIVEISNGLEEAIIQNTFDKEKGKKGKRDYINKLKNLKSRDIQLSRKVKKDIYQGKLFNRNKILAQREINEEGFEGVIAIQEYNPEDHRGFKLFREGHFIKSTQVKKKGHVFTGYLDHKDFTTNIVHNKIRKDSVYKATQERVDEVIKELFSELAETVNDSEINPKDREKIAKKLRTYISNVGNRPHLDLNRGIFSHLEDTDLENKLMDAKIYKTIDGRYVSTSDIKEKVLEKNAVYVSDRSVSETDLKDNLVLDNRKSDKQHKQALINILGYVRKDIVNEKLRDRKSQGESISHWTENNLNEALSEKVYWKKVKQDKEDALSKIAKEKLTEKRKVQKITAENRAKKKQIRRKFIRDKITNPTRKAASWTNNTRKSITETIVYKPGRATADAAGKVTGGIGYGLKKIGQKVRGGAVKLDSGMERIVGDGVNAGAKTLDTLEKGAAVAGMGIAAVVAAPFIGIGAGVGYLSKKIAQKTDAYRTKKRDEKYSKRSEKIQQSLDKEKLTNAKRERKAEKARLKQQAKDKKLGEKRAIEDAARREKDKIKAARQAEIDASKRKLDDKEIFFLSCLEDAINNTSYNPTGKSGAMEHPKKISEIRDVHLKVGMYAYGKTKPMMNASGYKVATHLDGVQVDLNRDDPFIKKMVKKTNEDPTNVYTVLPVVIDKGLRKTLRWDIDKSRVRTETKDIYTGLSTRIKDANIDSMMHLYHNRPETFKGQLGKLEKGDRSKVFQRMASLDESNANGMLDEWVSTDRNYKEEFKHALVYSIDKKRK